MKQTLPLLALLIGISGAQAQTPAAKPAEKSATAPAGASYLLADGRVALYGSHEMAGLVDALNAKFAGTHPGIKFAPLLKGTSTAMPALASGAAAIAITLGEATRVDIRGFRAINKYNPTVIKIGSAGYGPRANGNTPPSIYVNRANPLKGLTMAQLAGLFTSGSPGGDINDWSQLGLDGVWATRRVHLYGLRDDGDAATSMRYQHLGNMPFAGHYEPLPSDAAVIQAVAADPYGISLVGWLEPKASLDAVRIVPLAAEAGKPFALPTKADVAQGVYPLATPLMLYVDHPPKKPIEPFIGDYLTMVLSNEGQAIIARFGDGVEGFQPLSQGDLDKERAKLKD